MRKNDFSSEEVNLEEARIEIMVAGLIMIVLGAFLFGNLSDTLAMLVSGVILLGSAIYQSSRGWHVSIITWSLGVVLTLGGLGLRVFLVGVMNINFVALTLVIIGIYTFFNTFDDGRS